MRKLLKELVKYFCVVMMVILVGLGFSVGRFRILLFSCIVCVEYWGVYIIIDKGFSKVFLLLWSVKLRGYLVIKFWDLLVKLRWLSLVDLSKWLMYVFFMLFCIFIFILLWKICCFVVSCFGGIVGYCGLDMVGNRRSWSRDDKNGSGDVV